MLWQRQAFAEHGISRYHTLTAQFLYWQKTGSWVSTIQEVKKPHQHSYQSSLATIEPFHLPNLWANILLVRTSSGSPSRRWFRSSENKSYLSLNGIGSLVRLDMVNYFKVSSALLCCNFSCDLAMLSWIVF